MTLVAPRVISRGQFNTCHSLAFRTRQNCDNQMFFNLYSGSFQMEIILTAEFLLRSLSPT